MRGNICFDFFFSSCNHDIYILIVTRLFKYVFQTDIFGTFSQIGMYGLLYILTYLL